MKLSIVFGPNGFEFIEGDDTPSRRENKGKSLLIKTEDFTAIDLETTGLSPEFDDILELSAIRYRNGEPAASFESLVYFDREVPDYITELTGITTDMVQAAPHIDVALPRFIDFIGADVVLGHNVNFDVNFIYDNAKDLGLADFSNQYIDTLRLSRRLHKDWKKHSLDAIAANLGLPPRGLHRAGGDAKLAADIYLLFKEDPSFDEAMRPYEKKKLRAADIVGDESKFDEDNPLFGRVCVFTGALESFTRREAMQLVADLGGECGDNITQKTNFLVLGNNDYCASIKGGKSNKQKKAESLIAKGADLQIISESAFLDMLR